MALSLILTDSGFAFHERRLLSRLEIGLADEGFRVVHAMPDGDLYEQVRRDVYSTGVSYDPLLAGLLPGEAARRMLKKIAVSDSEPVVVHVLGRGAWRLGVSIANTRRTPLVLGVSEPGRVRAVPGVERARRGSGAATYYAPVDAALRKALERRVDPSRVAEVRWGVHAGEEHTPGHPDGSIAFHARGASDRDAVAALEGVLGATADTQRLVFIDESERTRALWNAARRAGSLDRVSITPAFEHERGPVLHNALLVRPFAQGLHVSLALDAMARGVPVLAGADPFVEWYIDGRTVQSVPERDAASWERAVRDALAGNGPVTTDQLRDSARNYVHERHTVSGFVSAVLALYERALAEQSRSAETNHAEAAEPNAGTAGSAGGGA